MHIHKYEKAWLGIGVTTVVIFAVLIAVAGFSKGIQVPDPESRINPNTLDQDKNFSNPGLRELAPGQYAAYIVAKASPWAFEPRSIEVPVGSKVTFYVTSGDVQHGFWVQETNVNMMVLPGQVAKLSHTFEKEGKAYFLCDEYCGVGHQNMYGEINITPKAGGSK